jgi:REP element-mobilizing transposase RayT
MFREILLVTLIPVPGQNSLMAGISPHGKDLRKARYSERGRVYLLTACCFERKRVFKDAPLGKIVEDEIRRSDAAQETRTFAHVVMPDHLHWMFLLVGNNQMRHVMKRVKGRSAYRVNKVMRRKGRIWQPGYHDRALRHEECLQAVGNYVIYNPVRAGLVASLDDYPLWDAIWIGRDQRPRTPVAERAGEEERQYWK